ncbi:hypothetical protein HYFRA_00004636 [Hymenoscyphus fraxineus]|uniref:Uncharacterized protein n=1 Tax=Hymenoscyphus fraxineus TaxID=746836 RepID=A0A9N9PTN6_9HELO|nr:hypothetical protein HYFRA_00004636 [Hymenoscyphus fraxineus]
MVALRFATSDNTRHKKLTPTVHPILSTQSASSSKLPPIALLIRITVVTHVPSQQKMARPITTHVMNTAAGDVTEIIFQASVA